jgi:hypothetical protein
MVEVNLTLTILVMTPILLCFDNAHAVINNDFDLNLRRAWAFQRGAQRVLTFGRSWLRD